MHHTVHTNIIMLMVIIILIIIVVRIAVVVVIFLLYFILWNRSASRGAILGGGPWVWHRDVGCRGGPLEAGVGEVSEWWRGWWGGRADDRDIGGARRHRDGCRRRRGELGMGGQKARVGRLALGEVG
jgi:hypothetical protein